MRNILKRINKAGLKFLLPLTAEETYPIVVDEAVKLVGASYASIILDQKGKLNRVYSSNPLAFQTKNRKKGNTYSSFKFNKVIISDSDEWRDAHPELVEMGIETTLFIPLSYKNKSIGVLTVNSKKHINTDHQDIDVLKLFGSMAALVIRKAQLHEENQNALQTRDLFISMAAHELRTPLTTLSIYTQLLRNKLIKKQDSKEAKWIENITWEASRMRTLIDELLVVSRIQRGKLHYELKEHSLRSVLYKSLESFQITHPSKKVKFHDLEPRRDLVVCDFEKLVQVFINILENAAKYSSHESPIVIKLECSKREFKITIQDKGKGIAKENIPHLFEGFYRGKIDERVEGLGMGLYLCKNIIQNHRGTIKIHSKLGKGTEVVIKLPRAKE